MGARDLDAQDFQHALTPRNWSFPADHGAHPNYQTEWWYYTGQLRDESGSAQFGYQLTFFRRSTSPSSESEFNQFYLAHAALSDLNNGEFYHAKCLAPGWFGLCWRSKRSIGCLV